MHEERLVREAALACLANLGDALYDLGRFDPDDPVRDVDVVDSRPVGDGCVRYDVVCEGSLEGPVVQDGPGQAAEVSVRSDGEEFSGYVVLDADGRVAVDEHGNVRFGPWHCLDPAYWDTGQEVLPPRFTPSRGDARADRDGPDSATDEAATPRRAVDTVRDSIAVCYANRRGGGGGRGDSRLRWETFTVDDTAPVGEGLTAYEFSLSIGGGATTLPVAEPLFVPADRAELLVWLTESIPDDEPPTLTALVEPVLSGDRPGQASDDPTLSGTVVLDDEGTLVRDEDGSIYIEGIDPIPPELWPAGDRATLPESWREHPSNDPSPVSDVGDDERSRVADALSACLRNVGDADVRLGFYEVDRVNGVTVTAREERADGSIRYDLRCEGTVLAPHSPETDTGDWPLLTLPFRGYIVLTADGDEAVDEQGRPRCGPWHLLDPDRWTDGTDHLDPRWERRRTAWSAGDESVQVSRATAAYRWTAACFRNLVTEDGDRRSLDVSRDRFEATGERTVGTTGTAVDFVVEPVDADDWVWDYPDDPPADSEELHRWLTRGYRHGDQRWEGIDDGDRRWSGTIVLRDDGAPAIADGAVRFEPEQCLPLEEWAAEDREAVRTARGKHPREDERSGVDP